MAQLPATHRQNAGDSDAQDNLRPARLGPLCSSGWTFRPCLEACPDQQCGESWELGRLCGKGELFTHLARRSNKPHKGTCLWAMGHQGMGPWAQGNQECRGQWNEASP
ncbi:hypothetical protein EYF80_000813 [Liparis tanakae]|uniref:Uncharacterized protein n=1 Tax=Liparis tanakae TaxID=230148 RepID=A0A4Z2JFA6_9TELE|nr:hypothetical protein EYF80_000813 [Liparis tanakae]